jgi:hypothetical protein
VGYVDHVEERGEELLAGARSLRLEGIVVKRADSPYVAVRSDCRMKIKIEETATTGRDRRCRFVSPLVQLLMIAGGSPLSTAAPFAIHETWLGCTPSGY